MEPSHWYRASGCLNDFDVVSMFEVGNTVSADHMLAYARMYNIKMVNNGFYYKDVLACKRYYDSNTIPEKFPDKIRAIKCLRDMVNQSKDAPKWGLFECKRFVDAVVASQLR